METTEREPEEERPAYGEAELEAMREYREAEYDRAVRLILAFERRSSPALTSYTDTEMHTLWIREEGAYAVREPISPLLRDALDAAVAVADAFERDYRETPFDCYDYLEEHGGELPRADGYTLDDLRRLKEGTIPGRGPVTFEPHMLALENGSIVGFADLRSPGREAGDAQDAGSRPASDRLARFERLGSFGAAHRGGDDGLRVPGVGEDGRASLSSLDEILGPTEDQEGRGERYGGNDELDQER